MNEETKQMMCKAKDRNDIIKAFEELRGEKIAMNTWWENASLGELVDAYDEEVSIKKFN